MSGYGKIAVAGGDTATPLNVEKRLRLILKHLPSKSASFLDCGCGAGTYVLHLRQQYGVDAVGIEFLQHKVAAAHQNPALRDVVRQGDIQRMPYDNARFDLALLNEVLEHVPDERLALREIHRVLKPGGILIVSSPNRFFPFETHGVQLKGTRLNLPPSTPFIPYFPLCLGRLFFHYGSRNYWPRELIQLCRQEDFSVIATDFFWQTFENVSGQQPWFIRIARPGFRRLAGLLERTPLVRRLGVSQILVLQSIDPTGSSQA